jgi:hypothetical protein
MPGDKMKKISFLALSVASLSANATPDSLSNAVIENLYAMKSVYRAEYAPAEWKRKYTNYDLDTAFNQAIEAVNAKPNLTQPESREILKDFIYKMKDYHVSIRFVATEAAHLPFTIKGADDRFFLTYIDRTKLPEISFPYHIGDELITFDGKTALQAVTQLQAEFPANIIETDRALAEMSLTSRTAAKGYIIPKGPITVGIKPQGSDHVFNTEIMWDYTPEKVTPRSDTSMLMQGGIKQSSLNNPMMSIHSDKQLDAENPYQLGSRKTFTPELGNKIWQSDDSNTFYAYTYVNSENKEIGYVRIPSYTPENKLQAVADFASIIKIFESETDAMIIDQVNNPGGSIYYLYALASMLTDQPLQTPLHRMSITQADVMEARQLIEKYKNVNSDEAALEALKDEASGYPHSYELVQFMLNHYRMIVAEWKAGHHLTRPYWLVGINHINPAPVHYTHPILVLTNHLDLSGGDFFPAILQDNHRATILGSRTAGAGGYVKDIHIPNSIGIDFFRVTESIAERVNGQPIENLGVVPDVLYEMTPIDYQTNFKPYTDKIDTTLSALIDIKK